MSIAVVDEGFYGGYAGFRDNGAGGGFRQRPMTAPAGNAPRPTARSGDDARAPAADRGAGLERCRPAIPTRSQLRARRPRLPPEIRLWPRRPSVEGNKLTVDFDKAGEKRVIDQFVHAGVRMRWPNNADGDALRRLESDNFDFGKQC